MHKIEREIIENLHSHIPKVYIVLLLYELCDKECNLLVSAGYENGKTDKN